MLCARSRLDGVGRVTAAALGIAAFHLAVEGASAAPPPGVLAGRSGMVVSVSKEASDAGAAVLSGGGNAVDAAVTVAFVLAVTHPEAGNIGGGGFMMVLPAGKSVPECIEYRETAPQSATAEMFVGEKRTLGHRVVGVPGTVSGLALAHRRHGRLAWREVVEPAVRLAEQGFPIEVYLADSLTEVSAESPGFNEFRRVYGPPARSEKWTAGDLLVQPDLARTLRQIADDGPEAFYRGPIARQIVAEMQSGGGLITLDDLARYEARVRDAIHGTFRGYDVYGPPPPSSGGICLVETLNVLEKFDLKGMGFQSADAVHVTIEAVRRAYRDRARFLGDPDFTGIPEHLTTKQHAAELAIQIDLARATPSADLAGDIELAPEGDHTTHFSVIDAQGMAVSNTYTLEESFGSRVVVKGAGFLLNNEMGDFNWTPGLTNREGKIGTTANLVAPGKRMLSSQTPVIVMHDGRVLMLTGSPGGRTIINTVLGVVLNVFEYGQEPRAAVDAPRWHHQWFPDEVRFEGAGRPEFQGLVNELTRRGHKVVKPDGDQGDAHTIWIDPQTGEARGVADFRRRGSAAMPRTDGE
jgi:gamma-glutamyltranspeptidase/glutathione hydrolase